MTTLSRDWRLRVGVRRSHRQRVPCSQDQEKERKRAAWFQSREWAGREVVGVLEWWSGGVGSWWL